MFRIFILKLPHIQGKALQCGLTTRVYGRAGGERKRNAGTLLRNSDLCIGVEHIVDGALGEPKGGGNGGADDVLASLGITAVTLAGKS
jgi:hypothetical protein